MNGRFGVDRNKLTRSSSIPEDFMNKLTAKSKDSDETACLVPTASPSLFRTSSLPVETEEEWRKRKEFQSFRRMEAKRKRLKKTKAAGEGNTEQHGRRNYCFAPGLVDGKVEIGGGGGKEWSSLRNVSFAPPAINWGGGCRVEARGGTGNISRRSSGGSSVSNPIKIQQHQESCKKSEADQKRTTAKTNGRIGQGERNPLNDLEGSTGLGVLRGRMPSVSTKGNGPNGKRVEGLLYGYRKGEEVRIVCVCHGSFLSPAEFVKHAGGGDVLNPLKHIVVHPTSIF